MSKGMRGVTEGDRDWASPPASHFPASHPPILKFRPGRSRQAVWMPCHSTGCFFLTVPPLKMSLDCPLPLPPKCLD